LGEGSEKDSELRILQEKGDTAAEIYRDVGKT
jgi:hypothetical protein